MKGPIPVAVTASLPNCCGLNRWVWLSRITSEDANETESINANVRVASGCALIHVTTLGGAPAGPRTNKAIRQLRRPQLQSSADHPRRIPQHTALERLGQRWD